MPWEDDIHSSLLVQVENLKAKVSTLKRERDDLKSALKWYATDAWEDEPLDPPTVEELTMFNVVDFPMPRVYSDRGSLARSTLLGSAEVKGEPNGT